MSSNAAKREGDVVQKTVFMPEQLYLRVKAEAVMRSTEIGTVLAEAVRQYFANKLKG